MGASVGVVATAIETGRATTKAKHLLEVDEALRTYNEDEQGIVEEPPTKKQIVLICWKAYVPAVILGRRHHCVHSELQCAETKADCEPDRPGYMALGKAYQEYRQKVIENFGIEKEAEIHDQIKKKSFRKSVKDGRGEAALLRAYLKRYFHATEIGIDDALQCKSVFALNGELSMNDFTSYLPGLDFTPEGDTLGGARIPRQ